MEQMANDLIRGEKSAGFTFQFALRSRSMEQTMDGVMSN